MTTAILILLIVVVILLVAILAILLRQPRGGAVDLAPRLEETDRRQRDDLERLRTTFDTALRESAAASGREQRDAATSFIARIEELKKELSVGITDRFEILRIAQTEALAAARKAQDERLDRIDESLRGFTDRLNSGLAEQKNTLVELSRSLAEQQGASAAAAQKSLGESLALSRKAQDERLDRVDESLRGFTERLNGGLADQKTTLVELARVMNEQQGQSALSIQKNLADSIKVLRDDTVRTLTEMQEKMAAQLADVRRDNEAKLEKIRETVDEKLQGTLEKRLGESFRTVSTQLEAVAKGLGEMQALASGVGDLKRVLTNVSTRGAVGEMQLALLLEQVLSPNQYDRNISTVPGTSERVEYAIRLPGRDDENSVVHLPIDSKFPTEDYERLQKAYDAADKPEIERARTALAVRLQQEAKKICEKYVSPPHTTDFALLFVPTEGLYAEAIRIPGLLEKMQRDCRVVLVGPTTLYAVLNSLQMGFRTLAIQKRSSDVWKILSAVKTEFGKFGATIDQVGKKLAEASNKIGDVQRRSRAIERNLRGVEALEATEAINLLPDLTDPAAGEDGD